MRVVPTLEPDPCQSIDLGACCASDNELTGAEPTAAISFGPSFAED
jgi:hypothetical protein